VFVWDYNSSIRKLRQHGAKTKAHSRGVQSMRVKNLKNETIATIAEALQVDTWTAKRIKTIARLVDSGDMLLSDGLTEIDILTDCHGTEVLRCNDWIDSYWTDIAYEYVNCGFVYTATVFYGVREDKLFISDLGTVAERNEGFII